MGCIGDRTESEGGIDETINASAEIKVANDDSVGSCNYTLPFISQVVRNSPATMGWVLENIQSIQQNDKGYICGIKYKDGVTEERCQDEYNLNATESGTSI